MSINDFTTKNEMKEKDKIIKNNENNRRQEIEDNFPFQYLYLSNLNRAKLALILWSLVAVVSTSLLLIFLVELLKGIRAGWNL